MRLVLVAALMLSSVSFGQTNADTKKAKQPTSTLIFEDGERVGGEPTGPNGEFVTGRVRPGPCKSMILVRDNFNDKLRDSVNDLH